MEVHVLSGVRFSHNYGHNERNEEATNNGREVK
jgi:hypothetical protein